MSNVDSAAARPPLVVIGTAGHGKVVADAARQAGFRLLGHLDDFTPSGPPVAGLPRLGGCDALTELAAQHPGLGVALGIGDNHQRRSLQQRLVSQYPGLTFPAIVHPAATISPSVVIGAGVVILAGAMINAEARLADLALINTAAIVEHDAEVGIAASLAPAAVMGGHARLGDGAALMMGALLRHRISVGANTIVGMGSVVLADLPAACLAWGNPARVQGARQPADPYL